MKFKNLRRPARAETSGMDVTPPTKVKKVEAATVEASASDIAEYKEHIKQIKKSYATQKWSVASMVTLLEVTAVQRRRWIRDECPSVKEIIEEFPCLKEPKVVAKPLQRYLHVVLAVVGGSSMVKRCTQALLWWLR